MRKILRNIRFFVPLLIKTNPFSIVAIILLAIFNSINNFCYIIFPKLIIEELMGAKDVQKLLIIVCVFVFSVFVIKILTDFCAKLNSYFTTKTDFLIDKMFDNKISLLDYFLIEDPEFADKLSIAKKGLSQYSNGIYSFTWTLQTIITSIITISGVIGIVVYYGEIWIILITIISVIVSSLIYMKLQKIHEEYNRTIVRHNRRQWYFNKSIMGFRLQKNLRMYDSDALLKDASDIENNEAFSRQYKVVKKLNIFNITSNIYSAFLNEAPILIILALAVYNNNSTIAIFTMLYSAVNTLSDSFVNLSYQMRSYIQDCEYQEDFINIMETESIFKDGNKSLDHIDSIEFKNVSFKYPRTDKYILKNINLKITDKEKVSLVGLNGSGKTTLIKLLCRFFEVKEGVILVNDIDIKKYSYNDYMRCLAVVFQDFKVISFNIKSNIGIIDDNQEKLYDCLKRAQALDKVLSLPNKEYTYINKWFNKTGIEFSGGELQEFALARALYKESDLMILDEPTSALDPLAESEIYYHFNEVVGKKLCLFISHRLSSCIFSDRILVIDGANIVEEGTHKELINNKDGLYYKMFTSQAAYYKS